MKDDDAISCDIGPLINKYVVTAFVMSENDVRKRPFSYNFDVF